ncbi:MAG: hypothetical protein KDD89_07630, partial [Anaerolineales bacterium]|nr:hypothetical protein [Anaerolineales bacterium]
TTPEAETTEANPLTDAFQLLAQAVKNAEEANRSTRISAIKGQVRKLDADFDEKNVADESGSTFKRLSDFVQAAADAGYVKISGKGRNMMVHSNDS